MKVELLGQGWNYSSFLMKKVYLLLRNFFICSYLKKWTVIFYVKNLIFEPKKAIFAAKFLFYLKKNNIFCRVKVILLTIKAPFSPKCHTKPANLSLMIPNNRQLRIWSHELDLV